MITLLLAACHGSSSPTTDDGGTPTDVASTPTHSAPVTRHSAPAPHSADPALLPVAVLTYDPCGPAHSATPMGLTASSPYPRTVAVTYGGAVHGCNGCNGLVTARMEGTEIQVWLDDADCDQRSCCELEADILNVPEGTWTVKAYAGSGASADADVLAP